MSFQSTIIGLCTLAVLLLLPPLYWHTHTRNIPAIILIIWLLIMNIIAIVNAAVWSGDNFVNVWEGHIWCDITTKLEMGASVGIPCAITDIVYNLHIILKATTVLENWRSWRKIIKDFLICLVTPAIIMGLSYVLQVFRYGIVRYNGCQNMLSSTWLTIVLYTLWMLLWSLFAAFYAILVLVVFYRKRKDVRDILHCTNSGLNLTRFSRLLILCFVIILIMLPLSIYNLAQDIQLLDNSQSFKATHSKSLWNLIIKVDLGKPVYSVWIYVLAAYLVFLVFGLGSDALSMYSKFLRAIKLGFIVDKIQNFSENRKQKLVGNLLASMGRESSGDSSLHFSASDTDNDKSSSNETKKDLGMDYEINYSPVDKLKSLWARRYRNSDSDIEAKCLETEIDLDGSGYSPYLEDEYSKNENFSFSSFSKASSPSDQKTNKTCPFSSKASTSRPFDLRHVASSLKEDIGLDVREIVSEESVSYITKNPFDSPRSSNNDD
ncbi:Ste3p KNAG_0C00950 [Huiozyma naganishii CBS 8797]|uniref:Uncharacterized protein n=1 Tax=Huiozyma naganishii (strain ATCC MYA-139 / BCRC 22969 / CBS 8797 / KCTC 17520 / NBRC 10181 / NCYC 3082 / Yp74L-3) TaxID=1071383 RepID=J7RI41_HUIN7|nr:hypothetical protein KNAG_0C00950 [Kazachstania naganishii CBS 8797]CCK69208.1 hypothetical protein KNAG_0C00950 [Kazachstania naganishii CBS 8797]